MNTALIQRPQRLARQNGLVLLALVNLGVSTLQGGLEVVREPEPQAVFAGQPRPIRVSLRNTGEKAVECDARVRILQTTSATAVQISDAPWKRIQVLPAQTIAETVSLEFPVVKAETPFLIQWLEGTNRIFGRTEVLVYPPDLLKELKPLTGDEDGALGLFDPLNQLKLLVKNVKVDFADLEDAGLESFRGKLAIIGPFDSKKQMREGLAEQIQKLARKGVAVVWIQPPPEKRGKLEPSFYTVPEGTNSVVIVQAGLVSDLPNSPQAQLNLIQFARLALNPEPVRLPHLTPQP